MNLYLEVTTDKYQLPLRVADSPKELEMLCGAPSKVVSNYICQAMAGRIKNPRYIKVVIDD